MLASLVTFLAQYGGGGGSGGGGGYSGSGGYSATYWAVVAIVAVVVIALAVWGFRRLRARRHTSPGTASRTQRSDPAA